MAYYTWINHQPMTIAIFFRQDLARYQFNLSVSSRTVDFFFINSRKKFSRFRLGGFSKCRKFIKN